MPEGPSIVILKEEVSIFEGRKITSASGNSNLDFGRLQNKKIIAFKSWGKHFLICFKGFYIRIHFLLFGSYRINERRNFESRLRLEFKNGEVNFYSNSIKIMEGDPDEVYDWSVDVMSEQWDPAKADVRLKARKQSLACDVLMDQDLFSGVGNIIKNEVLFRIKVHPEAQVGALPWQKRKQLIKEAAAYSWDFYKWKKVFQLSKHWLVYKKKECPRCNIPVSVRDTGKTRRKSYYCNNCQVKY
jgi:endonuclease-8